MAAPGLPTSVENNVSYPASGQPSDTDAHRTMAGPVSQELAWLANSSQSWSYEAPEASFDQAVPSANPQSIYSFQQPSVLPGNAYHDSPCQQASLPYSIASLPNELDYSSARVSSPFQHTASFFEPALNQYAMPASPSDNGFYDDRETSPEDPNGHAPYNKLLHQCLLEAPNHEMQLKDIYQWFRDKTPKKYSADQKGWQNSIRHNLSMNPVCLSLTWTRTSRPITDTLPYRLFKRAPATATIRP